MIEINAVAKRIENGLNTAIENSSTFDKNISFKIWSDLGKYLKPRREGNTVKYILNGVLTAASSANTTANGGLVMGVQSYRLDILIPQQHPRTLPEGISQEDYDFVTEVRALIDTYFKANETVTFTEDNVTYVTGISYGTAISGIPGIDSPIGADFTLSVFLTLSYTENGINSRGISIQFDGVPVNFETATPERAATIYADTYSGNYIAKNIVTSTVFSLECLLPSTTNEVTTQFVQYLLDGKPNTAHFVKVTWANVEEKMFFMMMEKINANISGVNTVGLTIPLIEVVKNIDMLNFPASFYVAKYYFSAISETPYITLPPALYYFNGEAFEITEQSSQTYILNTDCLEYDEDKQLYGIYMIANKKVAPLVPDAKETEIIQEGQ